MDGRAHVGTVPTMTRRDGGIFLLLAGLVAFGAGLAMVLYNNTYRDQCLSFLGQIVTGTSAVAAANCQTVETTWGWGIGLVCAGALTVVIGTLVSLPHE